MPLLSLALLLVAAGPPQDPVELPELGLTLELEGLEDLVLRIDEPEHQLLRSWNASLDGRSLRIHLFHLPREDYGITVPEDAVALVEQNRANAVDEGGAPFAFDRTYARTDRRYGSLPYGWVGVHTEHLETKPVATTVVLAGIVEAGAWFYEVDAEPALDAGGTAELVDALASSVSYSGPGEVTTWTDEECDELWRRVAPERVLEQGKLGVLRTEHYVILTDMRVTGGTGRKLGKLMEERYERIREVYPFDEVPGRRLLPIYVFREEQAYHEFLVKNLGMDVEQARRTAGIAYGPFYATSYKAPNDPVHLHEMTHQIFRNRLRLSGGGSWFQEGVAEYIEGRPNDRNVFRNAVRSGTFLPLRELFQKESLIFSTEVDPRAGDRAGDLYLQSACLIEFLRDGPFGEEKFQAFLHGVGALPRNDVGAIERELLELYGLDVDGLQAEFVAYWERR